MHLDGMYGHPLSRKGGDVFPELGVALAAAHHGARWPTIHGSVSPAELQQIVADLADGEKSRAVSA